MAKAYDRHHIVPRARCRDLGISPNFPGNVKRVRTSKHRAWHTLFGSMTAEEAIELIRREWSLSEAAQAEFTRLTGNVKLMRKRK
jgi:nitrate/TMAO reductase-like tetraheme cytochrome c subunit